MNALQLTDIDEVRGVNHEICHDILHDCRYICIRIHTNWLLDICWKNYHKAQLVSLGLFPEKEI